MLKRRETPLAQVLQNWRVAPPTFSEVQSETAPNSKLPDNPLHCFAHLLTVPQLPATITASGEYAVEKPVVHLHTEQTDNTSLDQQQSRSDALLTQQGRVDVETIEFVAPSIETAEPVYDTGIGSVTFAQLYAKTSRIVGSILRDGHQMMNPEDVDDCMQSGYFKVWQKLQENPDMFKDKPKRYIIKAIVFRSKAQRFSHNRHNHKMSWNADPVRRADGFKAHRIDTWIDLAQALATVAHQAEDNRVLLLGLYCLITQVSTKDVAKLFGHGQWTICKAKKWAAAMLRDQLPDYGPRVKVSPKMVRQPAPGLVTAQLFSGVHNALDEEKIGYCPNGNGHKIVVPDKSRNTDLRQMVAAYEQSPGVFPTGWGGALTFEQIVTDRQILNIAHTKAMQLGVHDEDKDDCVQQGLIKLWQKLEENPYLLADKNRMWTGVCIAFNGNSSRFRRHNQRHIAVGDNEFLLEGQGTAWTESVDDRLDITQFIQSVAVRYADNPDKLLAFYAIATSVKIKDVAPMLGISANVFAARIGNEVRDEIRADFSTLIAD